MANLTFPDEGSRLVYARSGLALHAVPAGVPVPIYADTELSTPATITAHPDYPTGVAGASVLVDGYSRLPLFVETSGAGLDTLWTSYAGGPVTPLYARLDDRVDALEAGGGSTSHTHPLTANTRTAAYTLALTDAGKVVEMNTAATAAVTVPPNASVAFPAGTVVVLRQYGAGQTTIAAGAGVTLRSRGGLLALAGQYAEATLTKRGTDEWIVTGDLA